MTSANAADRKARAMGIASPLLVELPAAKAILARKTESVPEVSGRMPVICNATLGRVRRAWGIRLRAPPKKHEDPRPRRRRGRTRRRLPSRARRARGRGRRAQPWRRSRDELRERRPALVQLRRAARRARRPAEDPALAPAPRRAAAVPAGARLGAMALVPRIRPRLHAAPGGRHDAPPLAARVLQPVAHASLRGGGDRRFRLRAEREARRARLERFLRGGAPARRLPGEPGIGAAGGGRRRVRCARAGARRDAAADRRRDLHAERGCRRLLRVLPRPRADPARKRRGVSARHRDSPRPALARPHPRRRVERRRARSRPLRARARGREPVARAAARDPAADLSAEGLQPYATGGPTAPRPADQHHRLQEEDRLRATRRRAARRGNGGSRGSSRRHRRIARRHAPRRDARGLPGGIRFLAPQAVVRAAAGDAEGDARPRADAVSEPAARLRPGCARLYPRARLRACRRRSRRWARARGASGWFRAPHLERVVGKLRRWAGGWSREAAEAARPADAADGEGTLGSAQDPATAAARTVGGISSKRTTLFRPVCFAA